MKIIGLNGSPRRTQSRTGQLVEQILSGAREAGAKTDYLEITSLKIQPCIACDKCHRTGYCVQKDDFQETFDKIMAAEGLVLGSPVYIYQVTAQLKAWIDRLGNTIHCQRFLGKYGAVVATAGGTGQVETAGYLEYVLKRTGMQCVGRLACRIEEDGLLAAGSPLLEEARDLGRALAEAIREKRVYPDQEKEREQVLEYFRHVMQKRREKWSWEYGYWREKGWL
ncbi:MAG: flavodoxin family protein [Firmicutes bacterium]|nr:flavodoxin family protein [Bacillota bacterium]